MNVFVIILVLQNLWIVSLGSIADAAASIGLNTKELTLQYGYPLELHTIQTEDGYLLEVHRIGAKYRSLKNNSPVLIYSGLYGDSSWYVSSGLNRSLAYILANHGYDVWLGNHRGSTYCKQHINLHPFKDNRKFWDFSDDSLQELAAYDIPATIDYILNKTERNKLYYMGLSQATTNVLALLAEKPLYNEKFRLVMLVSPVVSLKHSRQPLIDIFNLNKEYAKFFIKKYSIYELFPRSKTITKLVKQLCIYNSLMQDVCVTTICALIGCTFEKVDRIYLPVMLSNLPAGGSVFQIIHYTQLRDGIFRKFDHGKKKNLIKYNSETPPVYNLSNIHVPTAVFYGKQDFIAAEEDFNLLLADLSTNVVYKKIIEDYNHADILTAKDSYELIIKDLIYLLKKYS